MIRLKRDLLALYIVVVASIVQLLVWDYVAPLTWVLLYPAVFVAAALTGLEGGVLASLCATLSGWYFFMSPRFSLALEYPSQLVTIVVFLLTGSSFAVFISRLQFQVTRRATADTEAKYDKVLDFAADAIFVARQDGRYIYVNRKACDLLGYSRDELLAMSIADITPPEDFAHSMEGLRELFGKGQHNSDLLLKRKDGSRVRVEINSILLPDGSAYGACRDITVRHALEASLAASRRSIQLLLANAPAALAIFDTDMRYLAVSRRWLADFGVAEVDIIGRVHYDVFPEIGADWKAVHQRALAGETIKKEEDRFLRQDGRVQWLRWEVLPWRTTEEAIGGVVIFTEDVTERVEAVAALRLAEESQRIGLMYSPNAIFFATQEGRFTFVNHSAEKLLGYTQEELLTLGVADTFPPQSMAEGMAAFQRNAAGEHQFLEIVLRRKDGSLLTAEINGVYLPSGVILGEVRDVTAIHQAQRALKDSE